MNGTNSSQFEKTEWADCANGEISRMTRRLKAHRFLTMVRRDASILTVLMFSLFAGYFYFGVLPESRIDVGGIYCHQVKPLVKQLLSGELDGSTCHRIEEHIRHCESCHRYIRNFQSDESQGPKSQREENWERARKSGEIVAVNDLGARIVTKHSLVLLQE